MKKQLLLLVMILLPMVASAYDIAVENSDGITIYYKYINNYTELEVTFDGSYSGGYSNRYAGYVVIPEEVTYLNRTRKVTSIGDCAFYDCSVTTAKIPNSVTSIGEQAFYDCKSLTSVNIPNSVTSIGKQAFYRCSGLTSVTIPNSVTSIGSFAFYKCSGLTSVTIPNSVTSIGSCAFYKCSGLTSVTIPNSMTSIGECAFEGWDFPVVISLIENPFTIYGKTSSSSIFSKNTFNNATLYVPKGTINKYKSTDGWKDFLFIEEGTGGGGGGGITPEKCAKPTISYKNGKLKYHCETEGTTCQYNITNNDIKAGSGNEVQLAVTYNISVYATKAGYDNSETATATLCWIDKEPTTEGIINEVAQIPSKAVLIQSEGGILKVEGIDEGTLVSVYTPDGKQAGSAVCRNGAALVGTSIQSGNTAIVKIGEKVVKVIIK